jgi:hypothetical protein
MRVMRALDAAVLVLAQLEVGPILDRMTTQTRARRRRAESSRARDARDVATTDKPGLQERAARHF